MIFGLVVRKLILFYVRLAEAVFEAPAWEHLGASLCSLAYFTAVTPVWPGSARGVELGLPEFFNTGHKKWRDFLGPRRGRGKRLTTNGFFYLSTKNTS